MALGGTATALKGKWSVKRDDIAPKAVGTKQIGDRSVTAHKLHADSVRTTQISDKAVGPWKLRLGSAAVALGEASTTSKTPVDLGGPTATVQVPIPREGSGIGAPRIRDLALVQMVADLLLALDGKPQAEADITTFTATTGAGTGDGR